MNAAAAESAPDVADGAARLYVVAAYLPRAVIVSVGALGVVRLARGWHAYVGSARRGREARVARHFRAEKPLRWHVDYLFARHPPSLAWMIDGDASLTECALAAGLSAAGDRRSCPRFGSSDCGCPGHLIHFGSRAALDEAVRAMAQEHGSRSSPCACLMSRPSAQQRASGKSRGI